MSVLSCGTHELSAGTLRAAGLADRFARIEANRLMMRDGRITGIERRIYLPETKVDMAAQSAITWDRLIAVGDGLTDVPLLDRAGLSILIASEERALRFDGHGYRFVRSLSEAIALVNDNI
jgi:phosphoserine phosphatase